MTKKIEEIAKVVETILKQEVDEGEMQKRRDVLNAFLMAAIEKEDNTMQDLALMLGADITATKGKLLRIAIRDGNLERVKFLIKNGVKVTVKDDFGNDNWAIELASVEGKAEVVRFLIKIGVDVIANDNEAIRKASENDHIETVKLLIDAGADIDVGLIAAAGSGKKDIVELLINKGADVTAQNNRALKEAFRYRFEEVVEILIKAGARFS